MRTCKRFTPNSYHLPRATIAEGSLFKNWKSFLMSSGPETTSKFMSLAHQGINSAQVTQTVLLPRRYNPEMEFLTPTDTAVTVDICITTSYKELENVCSLAEVLANRKTTLVTQIFG